MSINVQLVCGPDLKFYDIVARWPGSTHDARIFSNSTLKVRFEGGDLTGKGILLGDQGYPCLPYLITPLQDPQTPAEKRFNISHRSTRASIERALGVLKRRFPELTTTLQYTPEKSAKIIIASVILHNIAIAHREPEPEVDESGVCDDDRLEESCVQGHDDVASAGAGARRSIIVRHFQH